MIRIARSVGMLRLGSHGACALAATMACLLVVSGCQYTAALLLASQVPGDPFSTTTIVGVDGTRVLFLRTPPPEGYSPFVPYLGAPMAVGIAERWPPPKIDLVAVDLETLMAQPLLTAFEAYMYGPASDGRWLAWADHHEKVLRVRDLESGAESRFLEGQVEGGSVELLGLRAGRLVLSASGSESVAATLVVIDLASGEQSSIGMLEGTVSPWDVEVADDWLALPVYPTVQGESDGPSLGVRIDLVDLRSGQRRTLPEDIPGGSSSRTISNGQVRWPSEGEDAEHGDIRSYDPDTGEVVTVATYDLPTGTDWTSVVDIGQSGVLLAQERYESDSASGSFLGGQTVAYIYVPAEGPAITLHEFSYAFPNVPYYAEPPQFIDRFVLFRHAYEGDYIVFDPQFETERRLDPFGV